MSFTESDLSILAAKGITPEQAEAQLQRFQTGFPYLTLVGTATAGNGIARLSPKQKQTAIDTWRQYLATGGNACKFVPASGAASRMFKSLFAFADSGSDELRPGSDVAEVIEHIEKFAFFPALDAACRRLHDKSVNQLKAEGKNRAIISAIISADGLNYGQLPKGLLLFHTTPSGDARTPVEEQISEGAATAVAPGGTLHLHFTVSPAHRELFTQKLAKAIPAAESRFGIKIEAELSEQKSSTDTIAANPDGTPFRTAEGKLLFRPGGHGALIENLNEIQAPVVFIKNIDNVVPKSHRESTIEWKQVLAGTLIDIHNHISAYLADLEGNSIAAERRAEIVDYVRQTLQINAPELDRLQGAELDAWLRAKLNRPLRVCGMVVNEGEPGGGPYLAVNPDGSSSPQILESHQIDPKNVEYRTMMSHATHFNPVDLVCYIKDAKGSAFDLRKYVDHATGFISQKSAQGRDLQALELPGLWNGAMSDWNTVFVEVPASTFNPVKTVNDLLRPAHQL
jgi:hypothetical protein